MNTTKSNNLFHIAFCVNDNYVQYICVTIISILESNPNLPIWIHILTDGISSKSEKMLNSVWEKSNPLNKISIHLVDDSDLKSLKTGYWSKYAWYRIFIPQILNNINKVLYLDADTLILGSLSGFEEYDLTEKSIGAVPEDIFAGHLPTLNIDPNRLYYCDGVMLMNLDYWRKNKLKDKILDFAKKNHDILSFPDQDCINIICHNSSFQLPIKYGITSTHIIGRLRNKYIEEIKEGLISPVIIHYLGWHEQPWFSTCSHYAKDLWHKYNKKLKYKADIIYEYNRFKRFKFIVWNFFNDSSENQKKLVQKLISNDK